MKRRKPSLVSGEVAHVPNTRSASAVPLGRLLIWSVALASAAAGVVHLGVAGQHLDHAILATAFVAMGIAQIALAGALALTPSRGRLVTVAGLNFGIVAVWATTRVTPIPLIDGLESAQPIGLADIVVLLLEAATLVAAGVAVLLPRAAARSLVAGGRRVLIGVAGGALALTVPGLIAPHAHVTGDGHHNAKASHHEAGVARGAPHGHDPMTFDDALGVLTHGHSEAPADAAHGSHPTGATSLAIGHGHAGDVGNGSHAGERHANPDGAHGGHADPAERESIKVIGGDKAYLAYEPATKDDSHSSALRWHNEAAANHHASAQSCRPSTAQQAAADGIAQRMERALSPYHNNPWRAVRDGFVAYPIPVWKAFHMVAVGRINDGQLLNPDRVESFLYAMTDEGLTAIGGMFIYPNRARTPPNPTGCLMVWHKHTGVEGLVTSFDPRAPNESMWMAHVWTYGGLDPWGRDFDGTEPHAWFFGYRYLPAVCAQDGECL